MRKIFLLALIAACTKGEHRDAREKYNEGVDALVKGDEATAEKALLDARSGAGVDPELRFRAAYDLGLAYAAHAEKVKTGKDADLGKALELEQQAVSWFSDAARLRKDDADTQQNLAIVRARAQALSDEVRRGEGKLEARLDKVIDEQRGLLEGARSAWAQVKTTGGGDPLAQQGSLTHLADQERGIVAEAGVIGDLASDEIDTIGKKADDKRSDEERSRVVQLKNLDLYLLEGRARIAEARRKLQELAAEEAVGRAEAALVALKRAREQLLDPINVLREVAQDELRVMQETRAVTERSEWTGGGGPDRFAGGAGGDAPRGVDEAKGGGSLLAKPDPAKPAPVIPVWLGPSALAERQSGLRDRVEEVRARLAAAVEHADQVAAGSGTGSGSAEPPKPLTPEQQKVMDKLRGALPFVVDASAAMDHARSSLAESKLADAGVAEREALIALAKAIELFADLKQTIDLAAETQKQLVSLLGPDAAKQLPAAERGSETKDALAQNETRMGRIKELLGDEVAKVTQQEQQVAAQAQQAAGSGAGSGSADPKAAQAQAAAQQLAQMKQQLAEAETLRGEADKLLAKLDDAIKTNKDALGAAKEADAKIDELRKLFFTVVEHLQQLIRNQGETKDQTSAAAAELDDARAPKLPAISSREDQHAQLAKAITDALAKQADEAGKNPQAQQAQGGQSQGPSPKDLAAAADEVRLAGNDMADAKGGLGKAQATTNQSFDLQPAVTSEGKALEHLQNALKLLQPPPKNDKNKDQQKQDQQKQDQAKQDQQKQDQQKQQGGAGQRARDEDAQRQRDKQQQQHDSDPVEQDW